MTRYALYKIPWNFKTVNGKPQAFFVKIFDDETRNPPSLKELQSVVGGLIQEVRVDLKWQEIMENRVNENADFDGELYDGTYFQFVAMYANEEGLLMDLPFNSPASAVTDQFLVGDVAVVFKDTTR